MFPAKVFLAALVVCAAGILGGAQVTGVDAEEPGAKAEKPDRPDILRLSGPGVVTYYSAAEEWALLEEFATPQVTSVQGTAIVHNGEAGCEITAPAVTLVGPGVIRGYEIEHNPGTCESVYVHGVVSDASEQFLNSAATGYTAHYAYTRSVFRALAGTVVNSVTSWVKWEANGAQVSEDYDAGYSLSKSTISGWFLDYSTHSDTRTWSAVSGYATARFYTYTAPICLVIPGASAYVWTYHHVTAHGYYNHGSSGYAVGSKGGGQCQSLVSHSYEHKQTY